MRDHYPAAPETEDSIPVDVDITGIARTVFAAYGLRGVRLSTEPGGTYCKPLESGGICINIDPSEIAGDHELTPDIVLAASVHEIGHALKTIEGGRQSHSRKDHFFWNLTEDIEIDTNARRLPAVDEPMVELYQTVMPDKIADQTADPLASQLMYGLRMQQVLGEQPLLDPRVTAMINSLRNYTTGSGDMFDIIDVMTDPSTSLADQRRIARRYLKPLYDELVEVDQQEGRGEQLEQAMEDYEKTHAHDDDIAHADSGGESSDNASSSPTLAEQIQEAIDQATAQSDGSNDSEADQESDDSTTADNSESDDDVPDAETIAHTAGRIAGEMNLPPAQAADYLELALAHQDTIRGVAAVFKQLARPTHASQRMTYQRRRSSDGPILHNAALGELVLSQQLGTPAKAIWRPVDRQAEREKLAFGGLDIHLLIDASFSMKSVAPEATAMAISLLEGLELARTQVAKDNQLKQPDVRTHVVAFGSSAAEIAPLSHATTQPQKGQVYSSLIAPSAYSTLVDDALRLCMPNGDRDAIILIVSDGAFDDHSVATSTVNSLPDNTYIGQFIIGDHVAITPNHQSITDTRLLPSQLLGVLHSYIRRYQ
jgi:hypothetical protein